QLPHIFDLFYQVQAPYEQKSKGSGIGLSLTRELVELHYGDIQARSVEGKGAEFFVYLPMGKAHLKPEEIIDVTRQPISRQNDDSCKTIVQDLEPQLPEPGESAAAFPQPSFTTLSDLENPLVLVVDDNADLRRYLFSAFEPAYRVLEAVDGKDGWEKASETIPDLVISDVMMPQIDGFELSRRIKQDPRTCHIPIILLTAGTSHQSMLAGLETGADDYIPKPFNMELLAARAKNLIELRRRLQERMKNQLALQPHEISVSPLDEEFYSELRQTIEKNLSDSEFSVEGLSNMLYMGRTTLYRKILALTGETPNQFIRSYRLRRAAQLLKANAGTVSEVAAMVGFLNPSYFAHCFKEEYYFSPSATNEENNKSFSGVKGAVLQKSPLPAAEPETRDRELILIVEDSPDMCDFIYAALGTHYHVESASDGTQGLNRAQALIPDLIVSDVMMPGIDGFELHRRLKSDIATSHIPIVLLTARASEKDILTGFEMGVDDYITKPFNTDILLARIRGILRLRSHLQAKRKRQLRLEPDEIAVCSMDEKFLEDVNRCIEGNLADFDFNVEVLADKLSIGRTTLYRKVLALTGENPTQYIRSFRLNKAAHMLKAKDRSITDIAFDVGFSSTPYFTRCFKEMFHRLPSGFRDIENSDS
ncbi:MAG TPA: response regulator, partial [Candidatus Deferrimicrobium sp.]|nr:response regulator [Candidatus Deferrimicrobium sp.]